MVEFLDYLRKYYFVQEGLRYIEEVVSWLVALQQVK
jgi:hypothetical protein